MCASRDETHSELGTQTHRLQERRVEIRAVLARALPPLLRQHIASIRVLMQLTHQGEGHICGRLRAADRGRKCQQPGELALGDVGLCCQR